MDKLINATDCSNVSAISCNTDNVRSKEPDISSSFSIVLVLFIIPGNISVICYMWRKKKFSSNFNIYVMFLSMADVGVGLFVIPINIVQSCFPSWFGNIPMCISWKLVDYGLPSTSMLLLDAIAYDRYRCVESPILHHTSFTKKRTVIISISMWIIGFLIWIPYFFGLHFTGEYRVTSLGTCEISFGYFTLGQAALAYYSPIGFLVVVYIRLLCALKKRSHIHETLSVKRRDIYTIEHNADNLYDVGNNNTIASRINSQNLKCFKTLNVVIIIFLMCWVPFSILWPLKGIGHWNIPDIIYTTSYHLVYINSAFNPFIYVLTSKVIRNGVIRMFYKDRPVT